MRDESVALSLTATVGPAFTRAMVLAFDKVRRLRYQMLEREVSAWVRDVFAVPE